MGGGEIALRLEKIASAIFHCFEMSGRNPPEADKRPTYFVGQESSKGGQVPTYVARVRKK